MTTRPEMELADYVRELTEHHTHAEHYQVKRGRTWYGANHVTKVSPLIGQLWANDLPSAATEEGPRAGFKSKPAARLDALDTAARIDIAAHRWVTDLGEQARNLDTIDLVRQLHGLAASAHQCGRRTAQRDPETKKITCCARHAIEHDVRSWWMQARIVTGWDSPAWTPDNTCPMCGTRGSLKIRLGDQLGMCTHDGCRVTWDHATIGLLADHIREESSAERKPAEQKGPCWCPVPEPEIPDLSVLCGRCGSARCIHAVTARLVVTAVEQAQHAG